MKIAKFSLRAVVGVGVGVFLLLDMVMVWSMLWYFAQIIGWH